MDFINQNMTTVTLTILAEMIHGLKRNPGESDAELNFRIKYNPLLSLLAKLGVRA